MIKKIIVVCIVALTTMSAMAQVTVNRGNYSSQQTKETSFSDKGSGFLMKYGVKAGLNMTSMTNDMKFDPGFGIFVLVGSSICVGVIEPKTHQKVLDFGDFSRNLCILINL